VIAISFVRSNAKGEVGFLGDIRRTNVAMTRAKKKLIMIGDSATLGSHPFYIKLLEYVQAKEFYRSVFEV
jgi:ATP-dependent RNA/DNA helicase IGHMBP2